MGLTEVIKIKEDIKEKSKVKPDKEAMIARMSGEELDEAKQFIYRHLQMEIYPKPFNLDYLSILRKRYPILIQSGIKETK
jgi:hypothetical protein